MRKLLLTISLQLVLTIPGLFAQDTLVFNKAYIPEPDTITVYTPQNTDTPTNGFPLLYLLHGWSGHFSDWNNHTSIQAVADKYGFIIVCPDGFYSSWYLDSPLLKNNQYRTFFNEDLVPAIHQKYKVDSSKVFITGLSMGGQGSINLFIDKPGYFLAAGSMSGILDITAFPDNWGMKNLLGEYKNNHAIWEKYSCVCNLDRLKDKTHPVLIDCGTEDIAYAVNVKFKEKAEKIGYKITFTSRPGEHNWAYWVKSLPMHMDYFKNLADAK